MFKFTKEKIGGKKGYLSQTKHFECQFELTFSAWTDLTFSKIVFWGVLEGFFVWLVGFEQNYLPDLTQILKWFWCPKNAYFGELTVGQNNFA